MDGRKNDSMVSVKNETWKVTKVENFKDDLST